MTKAEELNDLKKFIVLLPDDSYLKPWLEQELQAIEAAMLADLALEHYAHGFIELVQFSDRLTKREQEITKAEKALALERQKLREKAEAVRDVCKRVQLIEANTASALLGYSEHLGRSIAALA